MAATVAQLGARALRKVGVAIVADADRPANGATFTAQQVADLAVLELGIVVPEDARPTALPPVGLTELGARTARAVGINPLAGVSPPVDTVAVADIAQRALLALGINPTALAGTGTPTIYTAAQVATKVLLKLAVFDPDAAPQPADQAIALDKVTAVHDSLVQMSYVFNGLDGIPSNLVEFYISMTANLLASEFGKQGSPEAYNAAMEEIRVLSLSGPQAQIRAEGRVQAIHDMFVAEALASWAITAIPASVSDAYVMAVAAVLSPIYNKRSNPQAGISMMPGGKGADQQADQSELTVAIAAVRRVALSGPNGQSIAEAKVQAAHEALSAQGLVSWPVTAVPLAHAEDYVMMAATLMEPVIRPDIAPADRQVNAAAWDAALARLRSAGMQRGITARALQKVQAAYDEMNALGLVSYPIDAVPSSVVDSMAGLAAAMLRENTGDKAPDPNATAAAFDRVRRVAMGGQAGQALAQQKVIAVHRQLEARGIIRWSLYDLPVYAEEPYVMMAATLLAPEVGQKIDPAWDMRAERDLHRAVSIGSSYRPTMVEYF